VLAVYGEATALRGRSVARLAGRTPYDIQASMSGTTLSRRQMLIGLSVLTLSAASAALTSANAANPRHAVESAPDAKGSFFERIVVMGASASAGFGLSVNLGDALGHLIVQEPQSIECVADERFFLNPFEVGSRQVSAAVEFEPSFVVAVDFLFWYGYGRLRGQETRRARFERGLEELEKLDCPIMISTLPDMSAAVGKMLRPSQMPTLEALAELNERLLEWMEGREQVFLLPLPELLGRLRAGESFEYERAAAWPPDGKKLMQWDDLHPTVEGLSVLACEVVSRIAKARDVDRARLAKIDPEVVCEGLFEQIERLREERQERRLHKK